MPELLELEQAPPGHRLAVDGHEGLPVRGDSWWIRRAGSAGGRVDIEIEIEAVRQASKPARQEFARSRSAQ